MNDLPVFLTYCFVTLFTGMAFGVEPVAGEPPVKLYVIAGQSNIGWGIRITGMKEKAPGVLEWLQSDGNDVLYSWKKHATGKGSTSDGFVKLDAAEGMYSQDHIIACHLSAYWKQQNPKQRIAILKVQKGATSLVSQWNPGGRRHWGDTYYKEGALHATLVKQIEAGIAELDEAGIPWEGAGFFWYQGEGDSHSSGKTYAMLFEDLVYGAELETGDGPYTAKGVLPLIKNRKAPVIPVRISWNLHTVKRDDDKGALGIWGDRPREQWEPELVQVREALTRFADKHNPRSGAWVDVDDLPLKDRYHYDESEYIEIGERMVKAYLSLRMK